MIYEIEEKDVSAIIGLLSRLADTNIFTPAVYANEVVPLQRRLASLQKAHDVELVQAEEVE